MDYSLPGSSLHEILQARILEWVAVPFSNNCEVNGCISHYLKSEIDLRGRLPGRYSDCQSVGVLGHHWDDMNQLQWSEHFSETGVKVVKGRLSRSKGSKLEEQKEAIRDVDLVTYKATLGSRKWNRRQEETYPGQGWNCWPLPPAVLLHQSSLCLNRWENFNPLVLKVKKRTNC